MAQQTVFGNVITFLAEIGVYDVILPFLLVFTILFAILEKTKILGVEKQGEHTYSKKNFNAVVAFAVAFFVIASAKLVSIISEVMANVVLLLILAVSFLLLVGSFAKDEEFFLKDSPWVTFFMFFMFIGIVVIFLNALGWLQYIFDLFRFWRAEWASTIIFLLIIVAFIVYIVREPKHDKKEEKKETAKSSGGH